MNMARVKRDSNKVALAKAILDTYQLETAEDMHHELKDLFDPMFEVMLQDEMNHHLGYDSNDKGPKIDDNRRNGHGKKTLKTSQGEIEIDVSRDRNSSFEPQVVPKRQKDVSDIESKVLAMYARGMSHDITVAIIDTIIPKMEEWRTRPLKKCYAFTFVDCMYVTLSSSTKMYCTFNKKFLKYIPVKDYKAFTQAVKKVIWCIQCKDREYSV